MALYESLTAQSTPDQIAAAYQEFTGMSGGDTTANQDAARSYLTNLGIAAPTIEQSYNQFLQPATVATNTAADSNTAAPLYEGLTAASTADEIAAAYSQFAGGAGGDTAANQKEALAFLQNIGISQPTIDQAYTVYKAPEFKQPFDDSFQETKVDPYVYAYEYGVANNDFTALASLLAATPDSTSLIDTYNLNADQINQIEFGTGFDLDKSGG